MNKLIFKIFIILSFIFLGICNVDALSLPTFANEKTNYEIVIEDDAELLTLDELNRLKKEMLPLSEYGNISFKTISENYTSTSSYASNYYHDKFSFESGTLFLIDMDNRMIYIFSDGENYKYITTAKANIITDNVYTYATNKEYYECASVAFEQIYTILQGGKIAEPMRYISNVFISITLAFFICFIIVLFNSSIKKASNKEIIDGCLVSFNITNVNAVKTGQSRVYSPRDSGGSSGGGGGGGGSSGGGGGHSF